MFQSIILAGGFGTRLKSVSGGVPKPMVLVGGEPFLYKLMRRLESQGCEKIVLSLHYMADYVIKNIELDKPVSCSVEFSVEEGPLGTGGAIKRSSSLITSDSFIALNGDTFCQLDYLAFLASAKNVDLLVAAVRVAEVGRYGKLTIDGDANVLSINEKNHRGPGLINAGTYAIKKHDINSFPRQSFSIENDFISNFEGSFKAFTVYGEFVDIGIPSDYKYAREKLL